MPRSLHWVFKVAHRTPTMVFYRRVLGMHALRHEEFAEGCDAACNGPYDGKWSKTMVGYGPEDSHFVVELTYNYGVKEYKLGDDFSHIAIKSRKVFASAKAEGGEFGLKDISEKTVSVQAPDGYTFVVHDEDVEGDPVQDVAINVKELARSLTYWRDVLGMNATESDNQARLAYGENQAALVLQATGKEPDHAEAYGRIAFACPASEVEGFQTKAEAHGNKVLTPLVSLDTPGKATVQVVILADPDGYEICFVGDEAYRELSQLDPKANELLDDAMAQDTSDEYYEKRAQAQKRAEERRKANQ